ncbi:MAG TPA: molybdate ABC transporter substrate-binding protein [Xanthobacteraceae bacterium]|jgi:molybdenum ABC transporter molybdate-binding protein|nr:molybdate ABC transporter substrate-binding protein [Xanthobacteraceae bacterium]
MNPSHVRHAAVAALLLLGSVSLNLSIVAPLYAQERPIVRVLAAGSLRNAFGDIGAAFLNSAKVAVETGFGPSGVLRQRIEVGETPDLFASADMDNPLALAKAGKAGPVVTFARNRLCAFVRPGLKVGSDTLLTALLDPKIRLGTSTPKADPAGDYTWQVFAKADAIHPGDAAVLQAKALQLVGGPNTVAPPAGMDAAAWNIREDRADIFILYCSARVAFANALPDGAVVELPDRLATSAAYGLTLLPTKNPNAAELALFILSQDGQSILAKNGFSAPLLDRAQ